MKNIATALVAAQRQFSPALKTATNPHFRTKYADLSACVEAVIDALNSSGIFLSQPSHESDGGVTVETIFLHESGESFSAGKLHVPAAKQDPQGYGSALTYARRYSLMAACGIAPEDDDGNAATKAVQHKPTQGAQVAERRRHVVADVATAIKDRMLANDVVGAFEQAQGLTDVEEKTMLWGMLSAQVRKALKDHGESIKENT